MSNSPNLGSPTSLPPKCGPRKVASIANAGRKVQEETRDILQDLESIDMAEPLFKRPKCSLWNIECGNASFIGLPMIISLGAVSLAGVSVSGMATVLTEQYQKKLVKVTKLVDIVTSALVVFETSVSKALKDSGIDE